MTVDREMVEGRFDTIDRNLRFLGEYKSVSSTLFSESYKDSQAAKYSLLEIVEASIDIANHIIAVKAYRRAEKYSDMFRILREEGVLEEVLAQRLEDMARFRNMLVYRYGEVDDERVLEFIQHSLGDVVEYMRQIQRFVNEKTR